MLTFDDYRIVPKLTTIKSRSECDTTAYLGQHVLSVPLIVASMHSLVTEAMILAVDRAGSLVVQPRSVYYPHVLPLALSTGLNEAFDRAYKLPEGSILSLEVANGYQRRLAEKVYQIRRHRPDLFIMAGTVCDYYGYSSLVTHTADAVLMGIGVGNACTTTINTGVGLPAAEMLHRMRQFSTKKPIILCGGVKTYGDFVKAIAMGADVVMSGYLFKDCIDTGNRYFGEASLLNKGEPEYIEGREVPVSKGGKTSDIVIKEAQEALQSAMSYSDSRTLDEFRDRVVLTR